MKRTTKRIITISSVLVVILALLCTGVSLYINSIFDRIEKIPEVSRVDPSNEFFETDSPEESPTTAPVVKPEDTSALAVEDGQDLVTLLTCTPYGVNTERLLVRGHRVPYVEEEVKEEKTVLSGSSLHTNYLLWVFVGLSVTALFVFVLYLKETKLKRRANKGGKK